MGIAQHITLALQEKGAFTLLMSGLAYLVLACGSVAAGEGASADAGAEPGPVVEISPEGLGLVTEADRAYEF